MGGKNITLCLSMLFLYWTMADGQALQENTTKPHEELTTASQTKCGTADSEYTFFEITQSCYKVHRENATWHGAYAACVREGGHLAVVNSQTEAVALAVLFPRGFGRVSVGFSFWREGLWVTIHGQILSDAGYEKWRSGVPAGGNQRCGAMYPDGVFEDVSCFEKTAFICESSSSDHKLGVGTWNWGWGAKRPTETPSLEKGVTTTFAPTTSTTTTTTAAPTTSTTTAAPTTTSTESPSKCGAKGNGYIFSESTGSCYRLHAEKASWYDGRIACVREGGDLAVVNTGWEALVLAQEMRSASMSQCHIGFRHTEVMEWLSRGHPVSGARYVRWAAGEPNNSDGNQNCGAVYQDGTLDDFSCHEALPFICERWAHNRCSTDNGYKFYSSSTHNACYKVHTDRATWEDARNRCSNEKAFLADLDYAGLPTYLSQELAEKNVFRSFVNIFKGPYKKFLTVNGQTLADAGYDEWTNQGRKYKDPEEFCGSMYDDGKLVETYCSTKKPFICEKNSNLA